MSHHTCSDPSCYDCRLSAALARKEAKRKARKAQEDRAAQERSIIEFYGVDIHAANRALRYL